jgi:thiosulfate dehydrogenase
MLEKDKLLIDRLLIIIKRLILIIVILLFAIILVASFAIFKPDLAHWFSKSEKEKAAAELLLQNIENKSNKDIVEYWTAADIEKIEDTLHKNQVVYGRELIAHTAKFLGPKGSVLQNTNGMNCQNCHLEAGTKAWGNNYGSVYSNYPKYRARSGKEEDIYKRINDCIERSLNGKALDLNSKEMLAMKSYIEFVGKGVKKGEKAKGSGIYELPFLTRAADPENGKLAYNQKCQSCHQTNGQGILAADQIEYTYPPLWGKNSYNHGAGLFRLSRFAGYIKYNMPQGASFESPQLTDEEAWDIAAYVNSQPRPAKDLSADWPKKEEKPVDHPFGLYADKFSEIQHKFGPFQPIADEKKRLKEIKTK